MATDGPDIDLGHDRMLRFMGWYPDRELNPRVKDAPDVERYAALVEHLTPAGKLCASAATFAGEVQRRIEPNKPTWTVESWEPLTLSPSLLCTACGDHGFVRGGRWVAA